MTESLILGEHTDWTANYQIHNPAISSGVTLVCATNEGLHATCCRFITNDGPVEIKYNYHSSDSDILATFKVDLLDTVALKFHAQNSSFFCYVAGTVAYIVENHPSFQNHEKVTHGISIDNHLNTLPMKKGLSSSAAICVLVVKCFNAIFELNLTLPEIMDYAYHGEMNTKSKCGRMDQCVAMGPNAIGKMIFHNSSIQLEPLSCLLPIFFVVVDLKSSKDTVAILNALNSCFPFPATEIQRLMMEYVTDNHSIAEEAIRAILNGQLEQLGDAMKRAQKSFDRCALPNCPSQLASPRLHQLIHDSHLSSLSLAVKGVGSQGDGSAQVLCKDLEHQEKVLEYIRRQYAMDGFLLTIPGQSS